MLKPRPQPRRAVRGLTLVELMVTVALLALLLGLAAPNFRLWIRNAQVRTATDALQAGLRVAQSEAVRRNRQVVFFLTDSTACDATTGASAGGAQWSIRTVPLVAGDAVETVQCGLFASAGAKVVVDGPTAVCFNSMGRLVANAAPGVGGAACSVTFAGGAASVPYDVTASGADRTLRVVVGLGGQTRMCDPARTLSAADPDGCA